MNKRELKSFLLAWNKANVLYKTYFPNNRLMFPEPLQKDIVMTLYDKSLLLSNNSSYDFQKNIELKSSTKFGGGCTPFKSIQNACSRIIYIEIGTNFDVYEIDQADVQTINNLVLNGETNITLSNYKQNAKFIRII